MPHSPIRLSRRHAMVALAASLAVPHLSQTSAVAGDPVRRRGIKLGYDNFAVRAMGWNARQLIDHAQALECDSVFITDFGPLEGRFDDAFLGELRRYAVDRGVGIELGSWSICPTSKSFKPDWGSAEEHLALGIRMSRALGSRAFRVILGQYHLDARRSCRRTRHTCAACAHHQPARHAGLDYRHRRRRAVDGDGRGLR